ncbi:hypothetical protein JIP62_11440 [Brevundimonas vitis]|uniref:Uncharacterized protein n=1 Tax=Brevundimonas vitisensis TaxID=2800818 RepID=A0ABX7BK45_9CAUL|nr:hypothetical protein [Brevundimonas vitisensis]QQQ17934.1 hypothetical protein JIP62_11440 [Brevundimonas vitisensis]
MMMAGFKLGRSARRLGLGLGLIAALAGASPVEVSAPVQDPSALSPEAVGIGQVVTAAELAAWGRRRGDPGALILAARMLGEVPVRVGEGEAPILTPDRLLDEAASLSLGQPAWLDAIDRVREHGSRGVDSSSFGEGPIFTVKEVRARAVYGFNVQARGGEVLRIAAIGDGDTNIDLSMRDASGAVICRDGSGDHYPVCTVVPPRAGTVRIDIINRGDVWTKVQILSN